MRARQRHLKPKSFAATAAWDSRYISGLSDGNAVSTWSDLSGNGKDLTQTTGANQPLYKTGILGGNPVVRFDGSNDNMSQPANNDSSSTYIAVIVRLSSGSTGFRGICNAGAADATGTMLLLRLGTQDKWGTWGGSEAPANSSIGNNTPVILTMMDEAASGGSFFKSGAADGTWAINSHGQGSPGYVGGNPGQQSNIDAASFYLTPLLSRSMRCRLERALGYSFKIACS